MKKFFNAGQIAKLEDVTSTTVVQWIREGKFEGTRKVGREYRVPLESYHAWHESTKLNVRSFVRTNGDITLDGVQDLLRFIHEVVWEKYNPTLKIRGILPTMYKKTTTHSAGVVDKAREIWGDKVFPIEVPETISFPRAYTAGMPLPLFDPEHEGSQAYLAVARLIHPVPNRQPDIQEPAPEPHDQFRMRLRANQPQGDAAITGNELGI